MRRVALYVLLLLASAAIAVAIIGLPTAPPPSPGAAMAAAPRPSTLGDASPQVSASAAPPASATAPPVADWARVDPLSEAVCPSEMLLVNGKFCPFVGHRCVEWIDPKRDRCRRYDDSRTICQGKLRDMTFCIDRYEYPNIRGAVPVVMVDWLEARAICKQEGKRLCRESEWNFACEGTQRTPYPYGFVRDKTACNIDRRYLFPNFDAFNDRRAVGPEVARLDQRVPSGSMDRCISPFGVYDMTGNVDEWVVNENPNPHESGLKGGYWGPIRARCRPMTTFHKPWFRFYQVGFRCCADPMVPVPKSD